MPIFASSNCSPSNASARHQQRDGEPDAGDRSRAQDGRPADGRPESLAREVRHEQRHADDSDRLADDVAEQDAERDRRAGRALEQAHVDGDARVREREQRNDHVARPRVIQGQQPLVRRDRRSEARARRALELGRRLLAELAEALAGGFEVGPGDRGRPDQEAHRKSHDHRLDPGFEQRDPGRRPEQEVEGTAAHAECAGHEHRGEETGGPEQRDKLQILGVGRRDHDQRDEVVDHDDREDEDAHAVRHAAPDQREHPQRQGGVGGHRDSPAVRRRAAEVEREVDRDRQRHAADRGEQGERQAPSFAQLSHVELAPRLEPEHEEEERHQAAVHPLAQRHPDPHVPERERELGLPELPVRRRVHVHPDQRGDCGRKEDRSPARLGLQELPQRRLEPADQRRALREAVCRASQWIQSLAATRSPILPDAGGAPQDAGSTTATTTGRRARARAPSPAGSRRRLR